MRSATKRIFGIWVVSMPPCGGCWRLIFSSGGYRSTALKKSWRNRLNALFSLEKALYELRYELDNRPDWAYVPLAGLLQLLPAESTASV